LVFQEIHLDVNFQNAAMSEGVGGKQVALELGLQGLLGWGGFHCRWNLDGQDMQDDTD
jgi:hypothetical protein